MRPTSIHNRSLTKHGQFCEKNLIEQRKREGFSRESKDYVVCAIWAISFVVALIESVAALEITAMKWQTKTRSSEGILYNYMGTLNVAV